MLLIRFIQEICMEEIKKISWKLIMVSGFFYILLYIANILIFVIKYK